MGNNKHIDSEVEASSLFMRRSLYIVMLLITLLLIWAFFTKIDNYAKARGEAIPMGSVQSIQSLKGGRIDKILIQEGDVVRKGQILIHFDRVSAANLHSSSERNVIDLKIEAEVLRAFVDESKSDFSWVPKEHKSLIEQHVLAIKAKQMEMQIELALLDKSLEEEKLQLAKTNQEIPSTREELNASNKVLEMYESLETQHVSSKKQVLQEKQSNARIKKEYRNLWGDQKILKAKINSFPLRVDKVKKHYFSEALRLRMSILTQLREAQTKLTESKDHLQHRNVVSPIAGVIKAIPQRSLGSVISPGGVVAEIVPIEGNIIIEVKIQPKDIGFIKKGQKAILRFDAYEFSQYGVVYGKVLSISPTTFLDKVKRVVYYKIRVKPDTNYVGKYEGINLIIPGMTLECDIVTDKKTVFQALVKPIYKATQTAFRGR